MNDLEQKRLQAHLTQQELADKIGVSRYTVYRWEIGEIVPSAKNQEKLQLIFNEKQESDEIVFSKVQTKELFDLSAKTSDLSIRYEYKTEGKFEKHRIPVLSKCILIFSPILCTIPVLIGVMCFFQIYSDIKLKELGALGIQHTKFLIPLGYGTLTVCIVTIALLFTLFISVLKRSFFRK